MIAKATFINEYFQVVFWYNVLQLSRVDLLKGLESVGCLVVVSSMLIEMFIGMFFFPSCFFNININMH